MREVALEDYELGITANQKGQLMVGFLWSAPGGSAFSKGHWSLDEGALVVTGSGISLRLNDFEVATLQAVQASGLFHILDGVTGDIYPCSATL